MPVFNAEAYLRDSIESVLCQTFSDFEFIVINDGCTDKTDEILKSYKDSRIKIFENENNLGLTKCLNRGIELSNGKYILRTDADDVCLPKRFETQFNFMEQHPEIGLCGSWYENFGNQKGIARYNTKHIEIVIGLLYQSQLSHSTVMMRKETLDNFNLRYDVDFITAQDYDLWSRMAHQCEAANISEVLMLVRFHQESISVKKKEQQLTNRNKIITNQFARMGTTINVAEIELFVAFCNSKFDFSRAELDQLEDFLERIILANNTSIFLNKALFANFILGKWYHLCYNSNKLASMRYEKYYSSKLVDEKRNNGFNRLKLKLRSLS